MSFARVVIVMRTKDRPLFLKRGLDSVLRQSFQDWNLVVVNDGGAKEPVDLFIEQHTPAFAGKLFVIHHEQSLGMEAAAMAGIDHIDSEFVAIHNDDDTWEPDFLKECVSYLDEHVEDRETGGVVTHCNCTREMFDGENIRMLSCTKQQQFAAVSLYEAFSKNPIELISFCFRRSSLDTVGGFDETLNGVGDWDFILRFLSQYEVGVIPKLLASTHVCTHEKKPEDRLKIAVQKQRLKNRYLRQDLSNQRFGMGAMLNLATDLSQLGLWRLLRQDLKTAYAKLIRAYK